jgi:hypothetical protein
MAQQGRREWFCVTITGGRVLEISAQRSVALGLLQWMGPSAGVITLATGCSVFAAGGPPPFGRHSIHSRVRIRNRAPCVDQDR